MRRFYSIRIGSGFTLIEILLTIAIAAALGAMAFPALAQARERARSATCATKLKSIGIGFQLYAQDHYSELPRSFHSAGAYSQPGWATSISPYLGAPPADSPEEWRLVVQRHFRCPSDPSVDPMVYSYGLNVFFELDPDGDDYVGSPATWRRLIQIPTPSRTILLAETRPIAFGDHFMCHQWSGINGAKNALAFARHLKQSNYLFADGHVETLPVELTFNPAQALNLWNPSLAK